MSNFDEPEYGVFIIESMDMDNEQDGKLDGYLLQQILDLCDIPNQYFYIRTKQELENIIEIFDESNYQFLHFSCHGTENALILTYDSITYGELEEIIGESLYRRRLFLSACNLANFELAKHFVPKYHCLSVIGSPDEIDYDRAAVFWSSFYYLMYDKKQTSMPQRYINQILPDITKTFSLKLKYFSIIKDSNPKSINHLREFEYDSGKKVFDESLDTGFRNIYRD